MEESKAAKKFLGLCDSILDVLWFVLHVTSGMPYRCTTWATTRLRNGALARRNLRLTIDNQLTLFHWYDKSRSRTGKENLCAKFVADAVVQPFLQYLVYIRPVVNILAEKYFDKMKSLDEYQDYLFVKLGKRWTHEHFRKSLESQFITFLGHALKASKFRHVGQAFIRKHNDSPTVSLMERIFNQQFGHSFQTGTMYGVDGSENFGIPGEFLVQHCYCSRHWQWRLKMISTKPEMGNVEQLQKYDLPVPAAKEIHCHHETKYVPMYTDPQTGKRQRVELKITPPDQRINPAQVHTLLWQEVRKRYKGQRHQLFRTEWIERTFYTIFSCPTQRHIVIQPTGSGKSSLFQYVSFLDTEVVTVVIIALKAPLLDQMNFCDENGIQYCQFNGDPDMQVTKGQIMFVQLELVDYPFMSLFFRLKGNGRIGRVFIDECDLAIRQEKFRLSFGKLKNLLDPDKTNQYVTQAIFMTATLSPDEEYDLREFFSCFDATPARDYSGLPSNIAIKVTECSDKKHMMDLMHNRMTQLETYNGDRGIVFCQTKDEVETFSRPFHEQAGMYTGEMSTEEREQQLLGWKDKDSSTPVMVATTAFAMGVDYHRVTRIVVMQDCYSMADFCQMAGRGGRDRSVACEVEILHSNTMRTRVKDDTTQDKFMSNLTADNVTCRRFNVDRFLTGYGKICQKGPGACDLCKVRFDMEEVAAMREVAAFDFDAEMDDFETTEAAAPLPIDPLASERRSEAVAREVATVQNTIMRRCEGATEHFLHHHASWSSVCGVCYLETGEELLHPIHKCHIVKTEKNQLCYRCLQHHDTTKKRKKGEKEKTKNPCQFQANRYRLMNNHCSRCFLHRDGHKGPEVGPNCTFCINDFVRVMPIYAFHRRKTMRNAILQGLGLDTRPLDNFQNYMNWLFKKENDQQEMNLVRFTAYFMNNREKMISYLT